MAKTYEIGLEIPANKAWSAISQKFGAAGQWTSLLKGSWMEGDVAVGGRRVCEQLNGNRAVERIVRLDQAAMILEYELTEGGPPILKSASNIWAAIAVGPNRSKVVMRPSLRLKWWATPLQPLLWFGLNRDLPKVLEEFRYWAEKGEAHPRKQALAA